ncbi:FxSxx-COOH system tetratricopeptide repeat protein [Streptosporangium sp. NPDC000396]|uniref:FxSxx-COOH system tetratricopeptide repeat protein n=1 Tax=Streptosporangium sp. NPDC000396 TaxID=3366185 RepID=UPI00368189D6
MAEDQEVGQVITFYSYKGGTGRTMALANTAWVLANNGLRVLVVDWDLESPGLHKFFHPFLDGSAISATPGVIDIISNYMWAAIRPQQRATDWHLEYAQVMPHAVSLEWEFPGRGTLDFVSAGQQNRDYSSLVSTFDWDNFYERLGGGRFFDALRADMKNNYDYTLIDSRTGLSDIADVCTIQMPDILVDCFTMSDQSIEGASKVARYIDERYRERNIRILPVPMRIDDGEKEKLDAGRLLARNRFSGFPKHMTPDELNHYWGSVEIPYKRFYAFEETLATFGDSPGSPVSLLAAYERLTGAITEGKVTSFPAIEESLRVRWLEAFTRRQPVQHSDILLSYTAEDRMWADWIGAVLERAGCRVVPQAVGGGATPDPAVDVPGRALVVLSPAYVRAHGAAELWEQFSAPDLAGNSRPLTSVRVADLRLPMPFNDRIPVDLVRLNAHQATEAVLRAVGKENQGSDYSADSPLGARFPGTVPPVWNVLTRNAAFTGRNAALEKLRDQLVGGSQAVVLPQALYGLGGVGKTQVALEYAHRFMADYDLVWWISAEQPELINPSLDELAGRLGIRVGDSVVESAEAAREALRRGEPYSRWLLIFDNAGDPEELRGYFPGGPGHVLVTSRNQSWSSVAAPLEVDVFSREESVEHLLRRVPQLDPDDALQVAEALGYLPLAVEQAAAWLGVSGMSAAEYVSQLQTQAAQILATNQPAGYPHPVAATWNVSLNELRERSPAAVRMLQLCAFFSPDPISQSLLYSDEMMRSLLPYDSALRGEKLVLGRVIREISRFALAKIDPGSNTIQVHRLVQAVIKGQMTREEVDSTSHEVHHILVGARPRQGEVDDPENWPYYDLIWPHLLPSDAENCVEEETRQLLTERVRYLWKRGEFDNALQLGQRLADYWEETFGQNERQRLHMLFNIANVLRSQGSYKEARDLDEWVWSQQGAMLGDSHPHTLMTTGGLAADLRALGEFERALEMDRETYERWKELYGEDHPRALNSANNLAVSYRLIGDCFSAKDLDQDTLNRMSSVLGIAHPYTLGSAQNLARDMREAGEYALSVDLLRQTLQRYREVLSDDYIDTLRASKSLAVSLRKAGEQQEAMAIAQETYERYRQLYPTSPETHAAALELACCMSALDNKEGARELARSTMVDYQNLVGREHPYTLVAANNLTTYLRGMGAREDALALGEKTLSALRDRLGDNHPFTLSCSVNVANCAGDLGDLERAEDLGRKALDGLKRTLRARHPDTLVCQANLAITLKAAGRMEEAEEIREPTLNTMIDLLGEKHPNVRALRVWRRINRDLEPQPT